jgi:PD-(D/E)XK nuclease superfamily protein
MHRAARTPHPIMVEHGLDAVPFQHPQIDEWRENFIGMQFIDERTNLKITGAVDDIWQMRESGKLIIVDYKATAINGSVTLNDDWKIGYKRQMEIYTWLLRKQGFGVEDRRVLPVLQRPRCGELRREARLFDLAVALYRQ